MFIIMILAAFLVLFAAWFLTRPLKGAVANDDGRIAVEFVRDEIVKQLKEIESDRSDGRIDEAVAREETRRLEHELAQALRTLETGQMQTKPTAGRLRHRWLTLLLFLVVLPVCAGGMDYWQNKPALLTFATLNAQGRVSGAHGFPPMVLSMVAKLRQDLKAHPRDEAGWVELARANVVLGNLKGARDAYARAYRLAPDDETVLANYAWLLYSSNPTQTKGLVDTLFQRLYRRDPHQQDALWFLGLAAYNERHFHQTLRYWVRLKRELPPGSKARAGVDAAAAKIKAIVVAEQREARPAGATGPKKASRRPPGASAP